jgi:hypothetical protein
MEVYPGTAGREGAWWCRRVDQEGRRCRSGSGKEAPIGTGRTSESREQKLLQFAEATAQIWGFERASVGAWRGRRELCWAARYGVMAASETSPLLAALISTAYQPWNSVFLSRQNSHSRLISRTNSLPNRVKVCGDWRSPSHMHCAHHESNQLPCSIDQMTH